MNERSDKASETSDSVFDLQTWSTAIATAWVLSRSRQFTEACSRSNFPDDYVIEWEADEWKRASARPRDQSGRKPVMLFPSVTAAWQKLKDTIGEGPDFDRDAVLKDFPDLNSPDRTALLASVWRGDDPHEHARIPFSHAAWWVASDHGTRPVAFDDVATWGAGFEFILEQIVKASLTIVALDPPPARAISPSQFDGMPIEYPCAAQLRSPGRPGRDSYIACTIDSEQPQIGDRYFEKGNRDAKWSRLVVQSEGLLKIRTRASRKNLTAEAYSDHVDDFQTRLGRGPTRKEDSEWARREGYSRDATRDQRKAYRGNLPE